MAKNRFNLDLSELLSGTMAVPERDGPAPARMIDVDLIDEFEHHPYKVRLDDDMHELSESIKEYGVREPVTVRPKGLRYELIAGHRRTYAAKLAGLTEIPAFVRELDDETATILMKDTNLHRPKILPSENAFAYRMRMDAIKRKAGRPAKNNSCPVGTNLEESSQNENGAPVGPHLVNSGNSCPVGTNLEKSRQNENSCPVGTDFSGGRSDDLLAKESGESARQIQRYIRLTYLNPELLQLVDEEKISFRAGVELSYLPGFSAWNEEYGESFKGGTDEQELVIDYMRRKSIFPTLQQAEKLKAASKSKPLTAEKVADILGDRSRFLEEKRKNRKIGIADEEDDADEKQAAEIIRSTRALRRSAGNDAGKTDPNADRFIESRDIRLDADGNVYVTDLPTVADLPDGKAIAEYASAALKRLTDWTFGNKPEYVAQEFLRLYDELTGLLNSHKLI